jgi:hypothetical protein
MSFSFCRGIVAALVNPAVCRNKLHKRCPVEIEKVFSNTRIYDLNGDFEAIHCRMGWKINNPKKSNSKAERGKSKDYEQNRQKTLGKAKSKIRRLVKAYKLYRFLTLTFEENMQNIKEADHEFRKFIKRLVRKFPHFRYIAVREFQQRGAIHYHLAVSTYMAHDELTELWRNGFVWIERKKGNPDNLAYYLVKYLTKHSSDERLQGRHTYLCSHGMKLQTADGYFHTVDEVQVHLSSLGKEIDSQSVHYFEDVVWIK